MQCARMGVKKQETCLPSMTKKGFFCVWEPPDARRERPARYEEPLMANYDTLEQAPTESELLESNKR